MRISCRDRESTFGPNRTQFLLLSGNNCEELELVFHCFWRRSRWITFDPVTSRVWIELEVERTFAKETHSQANGSHDEKEDQPHEEWARDPIQEQAKLCPKVIERRQKTWLCERGDKE